MPIREVSGEHPGDDMQTEELPSELLLPPKRLGSLLAEARLAGGYSLVEAADQLSDAWSPVELLEVETGLRPVLDPDLEVLTDLYGIPTTSLIPERSRLVIDLDEGVLGVGSQRVVLGGETAQEREVLEQYLAMVYTMRDLRPGLSVPLRTPDLEVLSTALHASDRAARDRAAPDDDRCRCGRGAPDAAPAWSPPDPRSGPDRGSDDRRHAPVGQRQRRHPGARRRERAGRGDHRRR